MTIATLREFLKLPDCVIFIGSGISMWSGLPSWTRLLGDLAAYLEAESQSAELVRREIAHGDLLQAASYGVSKLTPASFGSFIRSAVQFGTAKPHVIHKAIVELGPTSFITTNYDTLVEQALRVWRTDTFFPAPVTNRHLVELADILSARSSHFIFKPHGDASDSESIILTREQYRLLLPGGERHNAFEALKTLLVTRPILYLGFGLRDPDFIHLRDLLLNIYQGAVRDHCAIMPDVTFDEVEYWRGQYGIKLHGYVTHEAADGSRDHRDLLLLLQALAAPEKVVATPAGNDLQPAGPTEAERVLALTRYTSGLVHRLATASDPIEARISRICKPNDPIVRFEGFEGWTTTRFLTQGPQSAYLIGLPGAGKSFALRLAARQLASRLQQACIDDTLTVASPALPILVDLKLYQGNLRAQIDAEFPAGFTLGQLRGDLRLKLFLDAFNEMPSEYLESGALFTSLNEMETEIGPFDLAITSRIPDGIATRSEDNAFYQIDRFDGDHVDAVLAAQGIKLEGVFASDIRALLSRPFFLQLVAKKLVDVPSNANLRDLYGSFVVKLQAQFSERFGTGLELLPIFSKVAYRAIEVESEAFPLVWLTDLFAAQIPHGATFNAAEVANWLVGRQALISYSGRRTSFIHQSITEYCAAAELARRSRVDMVSLREIIASKKWDQCLFLALALMEPATSEQVLSDAIKTDLRLAINAVRYAEEGRSAVVSRILEAMIEPMATRDGWPHYWLLNLPVGSEHAALLNKVVEVRDTLGGQALQLLAHIKGVSFKPKLLDLVEAHAGDFNFSVNGIVPALGPMLDTTDLPRLLRIAEIWQAEGNENSCSAISRLLGFYEPESLLGAFAVSIKEMPPQMASLLAAAMRTRNDDKSFCVQAQLLLAHPMETTSDFSIAIGDGDDGPATKHRCLNHHHVEAIWSARFSQKLWDSALSAICVARPDLAIHVAQMAEAHTGIEAIALHYCAGADKKALLPMLELLLERNDNSLRGEPFGFFPLRKLDWRERELLFAHSLGRDLPSLREALFNEPFDSPPMRRGVVDLATLQPAIEITCTSHSAEESWWEPWTLGELVAQLGNTEVQAYCLASLVDGPDWLRNWVKRDYLGQVEGLTSDALDDNMIAVLLADLNVPDRISEHWYNPLGHIATDRLVVERLLPLAESASAVFRQNLALVLRAAGDRHGKRYRMPA